MTDKDLTDIDKRQAHLNHIIDLSILYTNIKGRKAAHEHLKTQITQLELEIATELQEYLTNG